MVTRTRLSPSLLLIILILAFFGWQLNKESGEEGSLRRQAIPQDAILEKRGPRIALMTFVTNQRSYLLLSLKNKDHYARRHGYDFIVDYESHTTHRDICFAKFDMTERLIKSGKYDWIFWLDFDTLITNTDIKVETLIEEQLANVTNPEEIDYLFTHDCNGLNAGSYLVRGHDRSMDFFRKAWAIDDEAQVNDEHMSDQDSIVKLLKTDQAAADRVLIVEQTKMNAFPEEIACYDGAHQGWEHGMFVVHFAGAWAHVQGDDPTGQLMNKYEREIIWGDWKEFYYPDKAATA